MDLSVVYCLCCTLAWDVRYTHMASYHILSYPFRRRGYGVSSWYMFLYGHVVFSLYVALTNPHERSALSPPSFPWSHTTHQTSHTTQTHTKHHIPHIHTKHPIPHIHIKHPYHNLHLIYIHRCTVKRNLKIQVRYASLLIYVYAYLCLSMSMMVYVYDGLCLSYIWDKGFFYLSSSLIFLYCRTYLTAYFHVECWVYLY